MDYIELLQKNLNRESSESSVRSYIDKGYYHFEDSILAMQRNQINDHKGFDDNVLKNIIKPFDKGVYSPSTQAYAKDALTPKTPGSPYNFVWHGDFLSNFKLKPVPKGFSTYSTGTGGGAKKAFFEGYQNMFGLDSENTSTVEGEVYFYVMERIFMKVYE